MVEMQPDLASAAAELVVIDEWSTNGAGAQQQAADAVLAAWDQGAFPVGLLAHCCLVSEDGRTVLHYQQWAVADPGRVAAVATVPGPRHQRRTAYRRYRSTSPLADRPLAGCLVTVIVEFEGPDQQRQRDWIDSVFAAAGTAEAAPTTGLIAAHFHVSLDGTRVLNLAEWTTAEAHRAAVTQPAPRLRDTTQHFPGVAAIAVHRYTPQRS